MLDFALRESQPIMMSKAMFLPGMCVLETPPMAVDQEAKKEVRTSNGYNLQKPTCLFLEEGFSFSGAVDCRLVSLCFISCMHL